MAVYEQTFVMFKPEVLDRGLVGRVIQKFEDAGLKIEAPKVTIADLDSLKKHYLWNRKWFTKVGRKTIQAFSTGKMDITRYLTTSNPEKIGEQVYYWHLDNLHGEKIITAILAGPHAIRRVKQIIGPTEPLTAPRGTIRGDWCTDSIIYSNIQKRSIMNLVHRSSNQAEFNRESRVWFG